MKIYKTRKYLEISDPCKLCNLYAIIYVREEDTYLHFHTGYEKNKPLLEKFTPFLTISQAIFQIFYRTSKRKLVFVRWEYTVTVQVLKIGGKMV